MKRWCFNVRARGGGRNNGPAKFGPLGMVVVVVGTAAVADPAVVGVLRRRMHHHRACHMLSVYFNERSGGQSRDCAMIAVDRSDWRIGRLDRRRIAGHRQGRGGVRADPAHHDGIAVHALFVRRR